MTQNNSYDEELFAYKIRHALDRSLDGIDDITRTRLGVGRQNALAHYRPAVTGLSLAGAGGNLTVDVLLSRARTLVALLVLAFGIGGIYYWNYWNDFQRAEENEEIDSALLAGDLPINAYLDHGFHAWLEQPQSEQSAPSLQE